MKFLCESRPSLWYNIHISFFPEILFQIDRNPIIFLVGVNFISLVILVTISFIKIIFIFNISVVYFLFLIFQYGKTAYEMSVSMERRVSELSRDIIEYPLNLIMVKVYSTYMIMSRWGDSFYWIKIWCGMWPVDTSKGITGR